MPTLTPEPGTAEASLETVYTSRVPDPDFPDDRDMDSVLRARQLPNGPFSVLPRWEISVDADSFILFEVDRRALITFLDSLPAIGGDDK